MKKFLNDLKTLCDLDHLDGLDVNTSEEEILEIFKKIVISRKIEEPDQLNLFLFHFSLSFSKNKSIIKSELYPILGAPK